MEDPELKEIRKRIDRIDAAIERLAEYVEVGSWSGIAADIRLMLHPKPLQD